ncbi:PadR family transcriptional regulator [Lacrimispora algidixylanolytica]|uniref:PadR family transcriptional regulator n=1 Tax=Lacrimispora algidixylanolytica TaxID=94868 RepID=A0A419T9B1_9FIRM|nr:helix-turn-helix transcriptional regulator [Lacrimispora algidixylanolytica]RKD34047.1 PadR family transcriptional regulator [Lacrimispora algidixylanolytica]
MNRDKNLPLTETVYYILLSLLEPLHGYMIMQKVEEESGGQVRLAAGTLYGAIENLLKSKYIQPIPSDDKRRKVYEITEKGREILLMDMRRMEHMIAVTKQSFEKGGEKQ